MLRKYAHFDEIIGINAKMHESYTEEEQKEVHNILCLEDAQDLYQPHPETTYPPHVAKHLAQ